VIFEFNDTHRIVCSISGQKKTHLLCTRIFTFFHKKLFFQHWGYDGKTCPENIYVSDQTFFPYKPPYLLPFLWPKARLPTLRVCDSTHSAPRVQVIIPPLPLCLPFFSPSSLFRLPSLSFSLPFSLPFSILHP